jgi:hypothetical protein
VTTNLEKLQAFMLEKSAAEQQQQVWFTYTGLVEATGLQAPTVRKLMGQLVRAGTVEAREVAGLKQFHLVGYPVHKGPVTEAVSLVVCPKCHLTAASTAATVGEKFGFRWMNGKQVRQSWCRKCRSAERKAVHAAKPAGV